MRQLLWQLARQRNLQFRLPPDELGHWHESRCSRRNASPRQSPMIPLVLTSSSPAAIAALPVSESASSLVEHPFVVGRDCR